MSIISFGPNQKLNQQQQAAYKSSQKVKQAVWDTSHRLAALNNVPGVDDPNNGDNVDIRTATPLPAPQGQSLAVFEANATGSISRADNGQLEKAVVHAELKDGRQWDMSYQHEGDMLAYSAPSPSGQGQLHIVENLSNGTISMLEAPGLIPDFAEQLQNFTPPTPAAPIAPPPSAPGWNAPAEKPGLLQKASGLFAGFMGSGAQESKPAETSEQVQPQPEEKSGPSLSELAQQGKERVTKAVDSETGRKWGKLLIGGLGMELLDKARTSDESAS